MCSNSYLIKTTWDNQAIAHPPVSLSLEKSNQSLIINIQAPFFNSPEKPIEPTDGRDFNLWDYEVVEAFFLNDAGQYLELEFGPYGHYLVLLLDGVRVRVNDGLKLEYNAVIDLNMCTWYGKAIIPEEYFPFKVSKWNAYAIHGIDEKRVYESLYPVCLGQFKEPDFHRLEYFNLIDFKSLIPLNNQRNENNKNIWKN